METFSDIFIAAGVMGDYESCMHTPAATTHNTLIGYSLVDTRTVGKTAIDTFSRQIEIEPGDVTGAGGAMEAGSSSQP